MGKWGQRKEHKSMKNEQITGKTEQKRKIKFYLFIRILIA
jgi:hypothetical protein